jgi:hypothetical protein
MSSTGNALAAVSPTNQGWRPPQWSGAAQNTGTASQAAAFTMTVSNTNAGSTGTSATATSTTAPSSGASGSTSTPASTTTVYVFDSPLNIEYNENVEITKNPVQTGAALSDHAYTIPPTITLEFKMSDAMQSFTAGQWATTASRSVSCWQTMETLKNAKQPVSIATRLNTYMNMMIKSLWSKDERDTRYGLRCRITFEQILTAQITNTNNSLSFPSSSGNNTTVPQATGSNTLGQTQTQPAPASVENNNNVNNTGVNLSGQPQVTGSGNFTSTGPGPLANVVAAV